MGEGRAASTNIRRSGPSAGAPLLPLAAESGTPGRVRGDGKDAPNGFTLLEIIVALAVFSLAALALLRLEGQTVLSARLLDETMVAQMVARNVVVEALTDARAPVRGVTQGIEQNGRRGWTWRRETSPLGDQGAFRIDVTVASPEGGVLGRLSAVRGPTIPPRQANGPATPPGPLAPTPPAGRF